MNAQNFRLWSSMVILWALYLGDFQHKLLVITIIPFVLDTFDCGLWTLLFQPKYNCKTFNYQVNDKLYDLLTYAVVIFMLSKYYSTKIMLILVGAFLWRSIGVIKFANTRDVSLLIQHFDGINSTMVIAYMITVSNFVENYEDLFIILGFIFKRIFESYMHKKAYI